MTITQEERNSIVAPIRQKYGDEMWSICMMIDFYRRSGIRQSVLLDENYNITLSVVVAAWAEANGRTMKQINDCLQKLANAIETFSIIDSIPD